MSILVTGGAGYIGSHTLLALAEAGHQAIVVDDLSTGNRMLVPDGVRLYVGAIQNSSFMDDVLAREGVTDIIHFAASIVVSESVANPLKYYRNNVAATLSLLESAVRTGVKRIIFSSTAAVYGEPDVVVVAEDTPLAPINPYGASKMQVERMLRDLAAAGGPRHTILRYFNVAGADLAGRAGQVVENSTHLIKAVCETVRGRRPVLEIFGDDYNTPDGSCIRDFIHVSDLADAHVCALEHLRGSAGSHVYNCGYGRGRSVKEVIAAAERVSGMAVPHRIAPRRPGDPAALVADSTRLRSELNWRPRYDDLDVIIRTALDWDAGLSDMLAGVNGPPSS